MPDDYGFNDDLNPQGEEGNASFQELREHARQLEKQRKAAEKELEELRAFRAQAETEKRLAEVQASGLGAKQAEAFLKLYGDVTDEALAEFRREVLGEGATESPNPEPDPHAYPDMPPVPSFTPVTVGGSSSVRDQLTYEQYIQLRDSGDASNFAQAVKAVAENRVQGLYQNPEIGG